MPDDLDGISGCISPGVSTESGFEHELAERGIPVHMLDASVDGPAVPHPKFSFKKNSWTLWPTRTTRRSKSFARRPSRTVRDLILQMDIEGAEYRVFASASDELMKRFQIIVVEFHGLHNLFNDFGFDTMEPVFRKILKTHNVVHVHPNNLAPQFSNGNVSLSTLMEFTFHRRDRASLDRGGKLHFPHPLDRPNVANRSDVVLADCWWR